MYITTATDRIVELRPTEKNFYISNGFSISGRSAIEISNNCPDRYKKILLESINNGWIQPVAYVSEKYFIWEKLYHE